MLELLAAERASVSSVTEPGAGLGGPRRRQPHRARGRAAWRARRRIADIGSGAGFPGLVLAAALPDAQVDLIESVGRKCEFMRRAIEAAGIANAEVVYARSEELAGRRRAARPTTRSPPARSAASRPSPSWPRRCCARAACWSPGRAGATRTRRRSWSGPPTAWRWGRSGSSHVGPYAGSRHRHLHVMRKAGRPRPTCRAVPGMAKKRPRGRQLGCRADGCRLRDREPEGRRRQDDDRGQRGRLRRRAGLADAARRPRPAVQRDRRPRRRPRHAALLLRLPDRRRLGRRGRPPGGPRQPLARPGQPRPRRRLGRAAADRGLGDAPARAPRPGPRALRASPCSTARPRSARSPSTPWSPPTG